MSEEEIPTLNTRNKIIYALCEASELEHLLMIQYLFAAFALKDQPEEFTNSERKYVQAEMVRQWKKSLLQVAAEEMIHLACVSSILQSIGGNAHFLRPNYPTRHRYYRQEGGESLIMSLTRLDQKTIARFVRYESSLKMPLMATELTPPLLDYKTIGELYEGVVKGIKHLDKNKVKVIIGKPLTTFDRSKPEDADDVTNIIFRVGTAAKQLFGSPAIKRIADIERLVKHIVEQGEGSEDESSHWKRFLKIQEELDAELKEDPEFEPSRPVVANPMMTKSFDNLESFGPWRDAFDLEKAHLIRVGDPKFNSLGDNDTNYHQYVPLIMDIFNASYDLMLRALLRFFGGYDPDKKEYATFFWPLMSEIIRPLGEVITLIPIPNTNHRMGAGFEISRALANIPFEDSVGHLVISENFKDIINAFGDVLKLVEQDNSLQLPLKAHVLDTLKYCKKFLELTKMKYDYSTQLLIEPPTSKDLEFTEDIKANNRESELALLQYARKKLIFNFKGWILCRLPTDNDGSNQKRGATGTTFAFGDEKDLDFTIHFQSREGLPVRPFISPIEIGVKVSEIYQVDQVTNEKKLIEYQDPIFVDLNTEQDLRPRFQGWNHAVWTDGEPIDPFEIVFKDKQNQLLLRRKAKTSEKFLDLTPGQRSRAGLGPVLSFDLQRNVADIGIPNVKISQTEAEVWKKYKTIMIDDRLKRLKEERDKIPNKLSAEYVKLNCRINDLELTNEKDNIRRTRHKFRAAYQHTITGEGTITRPFDDRFDIGYTPKSKQNAWFVKYDIFYYDTDAMSCFIKGSIEIPQDK